MKKIEKKQWIRFGIWTTLYLLFTIWMQNGWLLLGVPVLVDIFFTKFIPWGAWKKSSNPTLRTAMEWIDDVLFALIAVYMINIFLFQNYQIPSSSLEKTLLTGDFLFVSKLSYGPRVPNTPLSFPLVQNTLPILNTKSYIEWPQWEYKRVKGTGHVKRNDIVVFNFPAGDTVALKVQNPDYYILKELYGEKALRLNKVEYGDIAYRPVDKRENYVKRCIGMPGDHLQIIDGQVYIDGQALENPRYLQFNYLVQTTGPLTEDQFRLMNISREDRSVSIVSSSQLNRLGFSTEENQQYYLYQLPLTQEAYEIMKKLSTVKEVVRKPDMYESGFYYPVNYENNWTSDNFGPLWIPEKGATIELTEENLALYTRCIRNYENNLLEVKNGKVLINGSPATSYTFKYDYYFMMGDNRHNSADSRTWGFVPEDHIVGKPIMIWLSLDKDRGWFSGKIRWNRLFRFVHSDNPPAPR